MILTWEDGHTKSILFGGMLIGVQHRHKRPVSIDIDIEELYNMWAIQQPTRAIKDYINRRILPSLADKGKLVWKY